MLSVGVWVIVAPLIAAQYILAVVGLIALSRRELAKKSYVIWNIVILLVFFAGSAVLLIYNKICPNPKK